MALRLYNTENRKKELFKPLRGNNVGLYTCGPTVYNYAHIGNFRTYIFEDLLRRYLKFKGYKVKQVMNITDVDDKTIRDSQKAGMPLKEFTEKYTQAFLEDIDTLNIERAEVYPRATDHIPEMVALIKDLLEKEIAYKAEDGSIYYSIEKMKNYGRLAHIKVDELKAGARVSHDEYEKDNVADFALWKAWDEKDGDVFWETELGKGRPGWHIECSAMSMCHLSCAFQGGHFHAEGFETIDIHTGGVDNMFPHHDDEIAQSEAASGKTYVRYWLHSEHLIVDGKKMSKSLGNFYTLRDLVEKGHDPRAIRYVLLSAHYRQQLNFTTESLKGAQSVLDKFHDTIAKLRLANHKGMNVQPVISAAKKEFEKAMDDDLNISAGLAAIFDFLSEVNKLISQNTLSSKNAQELIGALEEFDTVIGCIIPKEEESNPEIEAKINEREDARNNKDWATADKIRDELKEQGIILEDTPNGVIWRRA